MSRTLMFSAASAIAIGFAGPAASDVTAAGVWADWQKFMNQYGFQTTVGTAEESGDSLIVTDFTANLAFPDGAVSQTIDQITFKNQGDGTVLITMSPSYPVTISGTDPDGAEFKMGMEVSTDGLAMVASGDDSKTSYDVAAETLAVTFTEAMENGEPIPMNLDVRMNDVAAEYTLSGGDAYAYTSSMTAANAVVDMDFEDAEGKAIIKATFADVVSDGSGTAINLFGNPNMAMALRDGASAIGSFGHGAAEYNMDIDADGEQVTVVGSAASGVLNVGMGADGLSYGGSSTDTAFTISGSEIPFPQIDVAMAEYGFELLMPVLKSEVPNDFKLAMTMGDFTISDQIWAVFDPFEKLPRDPATISFDVTGKANFLFDILDPEQAAAFEGAEAPAELHALTINGLLIEAAGAKLTGDGDFTFDNSDLTTFDGMPAPTGALNMQLVGGNGLIDKLVEMGLLPDEQAMGARMMMGLFARPGDGPDTLVSTIEVKGDGSVSANGQRLR